MRMRDRLSALTQKLMLIPGLSGHEDRVRRALAVELSALGLASKGFGGAEQITSPPTKPV